MIKLKINKKTYKIATTWKDVAFDGFVMFEVNDKINAIYKATPEKREALILALTEDELHNTLPDFYRQAIKSFSNIPMRVLNKMQWDIVTHIYNTIVEPLVYDIVTFGFQLHVMKGTNRFKRRLLPSDAQYLNEAIPLHKATALQFCEANDIITQKNIKALGLLPIIYTEKQMNESRILKRFNKLKCTYDEILNVFFYICTRLTMCAKNTQTYLNHQVKKQKWQELDSKGLFMNYPNQGLEHMNL